MRLTLGEAARQYNLNKSTLSRYIKQGKITAEKQEDGSFRIDPAELDRIPDIRSNGHSSGNPLVERSVTSDATHQEREISLLREVLQEKNQVIADLRRERDAWMQQAQTLLLTAGPKKSWWRRMFQWS